MLVEITIRNIALIERLTVPFAPGLNAMTGETGAGKSIVVDSVNLALGARPARELIRAGAERASVQAVFEATAPAEALMAKWGLEPNEDGVIAVTRELAASGRNLCRVNGAVVPASQLRQLTQLLMDVHGQHEHQALMNPAKHLEFLDAYGDAAHEGLRSEVRAQSERLAALRRQIERLTLDEAERARRIDMLSFQIEEIRAVKPKAGEDERLEKKYRLYENGEKIASAVGAAYALVYQGEGRSLSAQESLRCAMDALRPIAQIDERFEKLYARAEELYYGAQDVGYELQDVQENLDYDPAAAERVADRLDALQRIKRKYGPELSDVLAFNERAQGELAQIEQGGEEIKRLSQKAREAEAALMAACGRLTKSRRALSQALTEKLLRELGDLGMGKSRFEVRIEPKPPAADGADAVEFLISPNPGEPVKRLTSIASGGELSRIMLALKAIAADQGGVDAMIFDEIDTGVSGRMAQVVGEKMAAIARRRQVICVTHLPQIAALADAHYVVEKCVENGRTGSNVRRLNEEGRVEELARMVGGAGDWQSSLAHARNMLIAAQKMIKERESR